MRMKPVCVVVEKIAIVIVKLLPIHSTHGCMKEPIVVMLTHFFDTMSVLVKYVCFIILSLFNSYITVHCKIEEN